MKRVFFSLDDQGTGHTWFPKHLFWEFISKNWVKYIFAALKMGPYLGIKLARK